jgi:EpsI family protein
LVIFNFTSRAEVIPEIPPLVVFPPNVGDWRMTQEFPMEPEVASVLRADDTLNRLYISADRMATLFIAFFKSQRTGQLAHAPKNCLPGGGWVPEQQGEITIAVPGAAAPVTINRYIVSRGTDKSLVLYWYQSRNRVIASEYEAKFWLIADSIRYNRSDTALVRVVVRINGNDHEAALETGRDFIQSAYPVVRAHLPT